MMICLIPLSHLKNTESFKHTNNFIISHTKHKRTNKIEGELTVIFKTRGTPIELELTLFHNTDLRQPCNACINYTRILIKVAIYCLICKSW